MKAIVASTPQAAENIAKLNRLDRERWMVLGPDSNVAGRAFEQIIVHDFAGRITPEREALLRSRLIPGGEFIFL